MELGQEHTVSCAVIALGILVVLVTDLTLFQLSLYPVLLVVEPDYFSILTLLNRIGCRTAPVQICSFSCIASGVLW